MASRETVRRQLGKLVEEKLAWSNVYEFLFLILLLGNRARLVSYF